MRTLLDRFTVIAEPIAEELGAEGTVDRFPKYLKHTESRDVTLNNR